MVSDITDESLCLRIISWEIGGMLSLEETEPSCEFFRLILLLFLSTPLSPRDADFESPPLFPPSPASRRILSIPSMQQSGQLTNMIFHPPIIFFLRSRMCGCLAHRPLSSNKLGSNRVSPR